MATTVLEMVLQETERSEPAESASAAPSALMSRQTRRFERIVEHNLKYLRIVCQLGVLPFDVDVENWQVSPTKSLIRCHWFSFMCFVFSVKVLHVDITFVASLLNPNWFQLLHFPFHLGFVICTTATLICLYLRPKVLRFSTVLLTEALARRDRVKSFSRQQLILAIMPIGVTPLLAGAALGFPLLTTAVFLFGPLLEVASAESAWESPAVYSLFRLAVNVLDAFQCLWLGIGITCVTISSILILEVVYSWCEDLRDKTNRLNLADRYGELLNIQIIIGFFNQIYEGIVFEQKIFCFGVGIAALVIVVWHGFNDFFLGAVNLYLGSICLMLYPLMYEKAALITGSMQEVKKSLLLETTNLEDPKERAFWRRRVKSIRIVYVMCGPAPVERQSLPLFYDFFISKFIDILLTT